MAPWKQQMCGSGPPNSVFSWHHLAGWPWLGHWAFLSLKFFFYQKTIALDDPLRCLPIVMFCNSNEHAENEDWLQSAQCLEAWCLTHFSILSPSSCSTGLRCWHFSPLKTCLLSWMSGLPWGHFYQALFQSLVLFSLYCSKELIGSVEWASMAVEMGLLCLEFHPLEQKGE